MSGGGNCCEFELEYAGIQDGDVKMGLFGVRLSSKGLDGVI